MSMTIQPFRALLYTPVLLLASVACTLLVKTTQYAIAPARKMTTALFLVGDLPVVQTASLALTLHVSRGIT